MLRIQRRSKRPKLPGFLQQNGPFLLFLLGMALIGFLAQFQWIGYVVIIIYAAIAFSKPLPAQTTFLLALLTLGVVPIAIILSNWPIAQNFAAYSFVLLVLGVAQLVVDLQREPRTR